MGLQRTDERSSKRQNPCSLSARNGRGKRDSGTRPPDVPLHAMAPSNRKIAENWTMHVEPIIPGPTPSSPQVRKTIIAGVPTGVYWPVKLNPPVSRLTRKAVIASLL